MKRFVVTSLLLIVASTTMISCGESVSEDSDITAMRLMRERCMSVMDDLCTAEEWYLEWYGYYTFEIDSLATIPGYRLVVIPDSTFVYQIELTRNIFGQPLFIASGNLDADPAHDVIVQCVHNEASVSFDDLRSFTTQQRADSLIGPDVIPASSDPRDII